MELPELPVTREEEPQVSLAEHEAAFPVDGSEPVPIGDAPPEPTPEPEPDEEPVNSAPRRHRARSQRATPADVPRIGELTKKLRETEKTVADLQAKLNAPKVIEAPKDAPKPFTAKEPTLDDFAQEADPHLALARAQARWDREHDAAQTETQRFEAQTKAAEVDRVKRNDDFFAGKHQAHMSRMDTYLKANPGAKADFEKITDRDQITAVMAAAVALLDDDSAKGLHTLVKDEALRDELVLQTLDKPLTPQLVAIVQRRIKARMQAVTTGSAAPSRIAVMVPRPPNPVRTTPQAPAAQPPGENASLAEHERFWGPKTRR